MTFDELKEIDGLIVKCLPTHFKQFLNVKKELVDEIKARSSYFHLKENYYNDKNPILEIVVIFDRPTAIAFDSEIEPDDECPRVTLIATKILA